MAILRGAQKSDECCPPRTLRRSLLIYKLQGPFWKLKVEDIRDERTFLIHHYWVLEKAQSWISFHFGKDNEEELAVLWLRIIYFCWRRHHMGHIHLIEQKSDLSVCGLRTVMPPHVLYRLFLLWTWYVLVPWFRTLPTGPLFCVWREP